MNRLFLASLLMLVAAPGLARAQTPLIPKDYAVKFQMSLPPTWETARDLNNTKLMALEPSAGPTDPFRENINVGYDGLPESATFEQYRRSLFSALSQQIPSFALIDSGAAPLSGRPAFRIRYSGVFGAQSVRGTMRLVPQDGRVYVITATAAADAFAAHEPLFERIVQTFKAE